MTCRHAPGDPNCSSHPSNVERRVREQAQAELEEARANTPDADHYEIMEAVRIGPHLVMRVQYPNCRRCAYEGLKVMVFLDVAETAALRWKRIDPHFRPPQQANDREAPSPAARFPNTPEGWADAVTYARGKVIG